MDGAKSGTVLKENLLHLQKMRRWWRFTFQQYSSPKHTTRTKTKLFRLQQAQTYVQMITFKNWSLQVVNWAWVICKEIWKIYLDVKNCQIIFSYFPLQKVKQWIKKFSPVHYYLMVVKVHHHENLHHHRWMPRSFYHVAWWK